MKMIPAFALCLCAFLQVNSNAATFVVRTTNDSPEPGTLRWALERANIEPGSTINFEVSGMISLKSPLPTVANPTTINGNSVPDFNGTPRVGIDFAGQPGLTIANGANASSILSLALVNASGPGITLAASNVTIGGNNIGLNLDGVAQGNQGDGIQILSTSSANTIGNLDVVTGIQFFNTSNPSEFSVQPVSAWQGLRNYEASPGNFLICGTSNSNGLLYTGPLSGGGTNYLVNFPGASSTSVYGPDNDNNGLLRLVGSMITGENDSVYNYGFVWRGLPESLPQGGEYRRITYPNARYQYTHSTMGDLAVGNADGPANGEPLGPGIAYIYDLRQDSFIQTIVFPNSKSNTAYGIWYNGRGRYTICGGYSPIVTNNLTNPGSYPDPLAQGKAYLVDYDANTGEFSNWTSFEYPNGIPGGSFITHFEGISSAQAGVYTMNADSVQVGDLMGPAQGSLVTVRRNADNRFGPADWVDLTYPGTEGIASSNSVYGTNVVGLVIGPSTFSYQATVSIGFQLSNVISANQGNGIGIYGSNFNVIAQNYIGTNLDGSTSMGNGRNGILVTSGAFENRIGGQLAGPNNPTGSEGKVAPVIIVPPQGNVISGNKASGVLINDGAHNNTLSSNFIGTNRDGNLPIGNTIDGVTIESAPNNALIGCTLRQDPFVFYNVVSGNGRHGVHLHNANDITIHANFMGIGANNNTLVPNAQDGLSVTGTSANTQVGGVIPLGNVISGNTNNGIAVRDQVTGFISFNTFGGGFAFGGAAPNGENGVLVTSTGGRNQIRTCILSGNHGNGVEIGGNASGVQVLDTACGTNTAIDGALPNRRNGVLISGRAHHNLLGGFRFSVEERTHFSGNRGYGVAITGRAHNNTIVNSNIGLGLALSDGFEPSIPNRTGGIYLGKGTSKTTIGGEGLLLRNKINTNRGVGLYIDSSIQNEIVNNLILNNRESGVFATGQCDFTSLRGNAVFGNGFLGVFNYNISFASGIFLFP